MRRPTYKQSQSKEKAIKSGCPKTCSVKPTIFYVNTATSAVPNTPSYWDSETNLKEEKIMINLGQLPSQPRLKTHDQPHNNSLKTHNLSLITNRDDTDS